MNNQNEFEEIVSQASIAFKKITEIMKKDGMTQYRMVFSDNKGNAVAGAFFTLGHGETIWMIQASEDLDKANEKDEL